MTERAIELYKEACEFAYSVCKEEGRPGGPSDHIWHTLSTGRFAELIVRECNRAVLEVPCYYKDYRSQIETAVINDCGRAVLEHFGLSDV